MQCDEFESAMQQRLDRVPVTIDDASLRRHAAQCTRCRDLEDGFRLLGQAFLIRQVPEPTARLTDNILAEVLPRSITSPRWWLGPAVSLAAAASLLIALAIKFGPTRPDPESAANGKAIAPDGSQANQDELLFPELDGRDEAMLVDAVGPVSEILRVVGRTLGSPVRPIALSATEAFESLLRDLPEADASMMSVPGMRDWIPAPTKSKMDQTGPSS